MLECKKIHELLGSNRDLIKKLPDLLFRHLECYEKAHLDESAESSRSIEDGNFLEELNNFKQASFEFVDSLTTIKKNFTTLLTREEHPTQTLHPNTTTNFNVFVAQHCENVVRHHLEEISTVNVQENVPKMEREG